MLFLSIIILLVNLMRLDSTIKLIFPYAFSSIALLFGLISAAAAKADQEVLRFESAIRPIFAANCLACHGETLQQNGLDLRTRESVLQGGEAGPAVKAGSAEESLLFEKVLSGSMPIGDDKLSTQEIELIRHWIDAGALSEGEEVGSTLNPSGETQVTERDVMVPILQVRCVVCHGRRNQEGGLDLRTRASLLKGGRSGPAIIPGKPDESLLVQRVAAQQMPPPESLRAYTIRPVTSEELEKLRQWIAAGAPAGPEEVLEVGSGPDPLVSEKDRRFWSFQPPKRSSVPKVRSQELVRTPIDAFLLAKLEAKGLGFSSEAERLTLMRRAYFDLIGLPPEPDEIEAHLKDRSPLAYERMIDRLLASPHYGERWARHWLDPAGYSDSEGKVENDLVRPQLHRYRDYVIRSLNSDKPYDEFLVEQIAGDELFDYKSTPEPTADQLDKLVATGFLRTAPDGSYSLAGNKVSDRLNILADQVEIFSSSVMGLTMACAQCHSHKYDPIPQRDYYRLSAIFRTAYDPYDWLFPNYNIDDLEGKTVFAMRHLTTVPERERREAEAYNASIEEEIKRLKSSLEEAARPLREKLFEEKLAKLPEEVREDLRKALHPSADPRSARDKYLQERCFKCKEDPRKALPIPDDPRSGVQKYLVEKFGALVKVEPVELEERFEDFKTQAAKIKKAIGEAKDRLRPEPKVRALFDMGGEPTPTHLLRRADYLNPGPLVRPGVPSVLRDGIAPYQLIKPPWKTDTSGRRLALARWLVQPNHPLTARVMVNRIWQHHFGTGLVATPGDFGHTGARPSHPELLDWLATEFVHRGWSLKEMHKLMMTSAAYRQSSRFDESRHGADPDNVLLSRFTMRRLDADAIRDSLLKVARRLDTTPFGPADKAEVQPDGEVVSECSQGGCRRSIYTLQRRTKPNTLLEAFDAPQMTPNCLKRGHSTVSSQALQLWNSDVVRKNARYFAGRVIDAVGTDVEKQIDQIYLTALSRWPSEEERAMRVEQVREFTQHWLQHLEKEVPAEPKQIKARWLALATLCHSILNSAEFIYID